MLLRALISVALATAAAAGECDKTISFGMLTGAGPAAVLGPSNWLDYDGTCFTWMRQAGTRRSLESVTRGDLDLAVVDTTTFAMGALLLLLKYALRTVEAQFEGAAAAEHKRAAL